MSGDIRKMQGPDIVFKAQSEATGVFTTTHASNLLNDVAHGLVNGQCISLKAETTMPTSLTAGTYYYVIESADDTFQIALTPGGTAVTFGSDGTGDLTWAKEVAGAVIDVSLYKHPIVIIDASSDPDVTLVIVGSHSKTPPTFIEPQSATNSYDALNSVDQEDATALPGDEGVIIASADHRQIAVNVNGMHWITVKTLAFFGGDLNVKIKCYDNN